MNTLPAEIINLMARLVPTSYAIIARLSRWHYGCVIGDIELIKTLSLRPIKTLYSVYDALPNGAKHGKYREFYESDKIHREIDYVNGVKHGNCIEYCLDGRKNSEVEYRNDKRNGKYVNYHDNGKIATMTNYTNDQVNGIIVSYDDTGQLYYRAYVISGVIQPGFKYYSKLTGKTRLCYY